MSLEIEPFQKKIAAAEQILVVYGENASFGGVAAATSLYLWLRDQGKKVTIVSPAAPVVEYSRLVGINKVKTALAGENLVITLPFPAKTIDRVTSDLNQHDDVLSLVIKPKRGQAPAPISSLPVTYQAPDYDLMILIDVHDSSELLRLGTVSGNYWVQESRNIVWTDFANPAPVPAAITLTLSKNDTYALAWGNFCRLHGLAIDSDQASNLLMALEEESEHFSSARTSADVFELAAWLLRQGGLLLRRWPLPFRAASH